MEEIGIEDARRQLGEVVDRARLAGRHTVITRQGKPAAVVVGYDWLRGVAALIEDVTALEEYRERTAAIRGGRRSAGLLPQDERVVHHIDGDPHNNDLPNLRIIDPKENL